MKLSSNLSHEFQAFITHESWLDEPTRSALVELLFNFFYTPLPQARQILASLQLGERSPNWHRVLDELLGQDSLRKLTLNNEDFALSVTQDVIQWLSSSHHSFEAQHDFQEEAILFQRLQSATYSESQSQWQEIWEKLQQWYPEQSPSWQFYEKRFHALKTPESVKGIPLPDKNREILLQNVIQDWGEQLAKKKLNQESLFLDQKYTTYLSELQQKTQDLYDLGDLIAPYYNFLGKAWNESIGNWSQIDWNQLEELATDLKKDSQLRTLVEILGKFQLEKQLQEEYIFEKPKPRTEWQPNPMGKSEIIGVHHSDHLSSLLPSEVALLSSPETEIIFSKKYVEKKLLTFQHRSMDSSAKDEHNIPTKSARPTENKGPVILCIDTSGSMFGGPERIAKALSLAMLELAIQEKRAAYVISFSTAIQTFELTGVENNFEQLIKFLKMSFHGGTDIQPALREAMQMLETQRFRYADILVISDFIIPRVEMTLVERIEAARMQFDTKFHSLLVTRRPDRRSVPLAIFDSHWLYDLDNPGVVRQSLEHLEHVVAHEFPKP